MSAYTRVPYVHNPGVHERFYGLDKKRNGRLGKRAMEVPKLDDEENDCGFEVHREEHWIHSRPTWSTASGKGCWSYLVIKLA